MIVSNTAWALAATAPTYLEMQNTGVTRLAYVFAGSLPGPSAIALDSDEHYILQPGSEPYIYRGAALGSNVYVRSLGAKTGRLVINKAP